MASTKDTIIQLGDALIRDKGYNAFSYHDISKALGIKNAAIHYYFPNKSDLGSAIIKDHIDKVAALRDSLKEKDPLTKLKSFLQIYTSIKSQNMVCIVGSLATDLHSIDKNMETLLRTLAENIIQWIIEILEEGKKAKIFAYENPSRVQALMIISNMLASVQLSRLTNENDFKKIKETVINQIKVK